MKDDRYIVFNLGHEEFGVPLLHVKEVIAKPELTKVPQTPNYFLGIMNLRGQIISVLDLRLKLGIKSQASKEEAVIIAEIHGVTLGLMVDSVNFVLSLDDPNQLRPVDDQALKNKFITSIYNKEKSLVLIMELAGLFGISEIQKTSQTAA